MGEPVLLVDDEESILSSLFRLFRKDDYEIFRATSGAEGLRIAEENDISLIISDYRMPGMTGVEFLSQVKDIVPDAIRIMLTGYADLEASIAAINRGEVYRFITKPWSDEALKMTVSQALEYRELMLMNRRLTRTVKRQHHILKKLEGDYPGISEVTRLEDGAIVVEEDDLEDFNLEEILDVSDAGSGIEEEKISKIFDPFFTTREPGKGAGLGLSIAYNIIKKHKGKIHVVSSVGEWTTFIVELPLEMGLSEGAHE